MKEIILLVTSYSSDPNKFEPKQLLETVSNLAKHVAKAQTNDNDLEIIWFTNNPAILPFIKHFLTEAEIANHVILKSVEENDDIDAWENDLRDEIEQCTPSSAIECVAPDTLEGLPILFYGLQAAESDLVELLGEPVWYQKYSTILPSTHSEKALTWLYFLQVNANCEWNERGAQDYLIDTSALSFLLHGFESVIENSFFNFCPESVMDALPLIDSVYITLRLNEENKQQVLDVLEEPDDQISYATHETLKLVSRQHAGQVSATISNYLGNDPSVFYTLWSSIWPDGALLQANRFTSVLDTAEDKRLKLRGHEFISAPDFSLVDLD